MSGHGSEAGYRQHRKLKEQACGNCLWAHNQYNKQRIALARNSVSATRSPLPQ
jgi:hypothetical protein